VSLMEALAVVHNEETRLRSAGLLQLTSSSVLVARSRILGSSPKVPVSAASGGPRTHSSSGLHGNHYNKDGMMRTIVARRSDRLSLTEAGIPRRLSLSILIHSRRSSCYFVVLLSLHLLELQVLSLLELQLLSLLSLLP
jgi:hypothetical protein